MHVSTKIVKWCELCVSTCVFVLIYVSPSCLACTTLRTALIRQTTGQDLIRPPESLAGEEIRRHFLTSTGVVGAGQFGEVHLAELDKGYITPTHRPEEGTMMVAVSCSNRLSWW